MSFSAQGYFDSSNSQSGSDSHPDANCPSREFLVYRVSLAMRAAQLGWAAGFLDGEGCIHIARQRYRTPRADTYRLCVQIAQNDRDALEHFRAVVGIDSPIFAVKRAPNHRRQCYTLNYSGKRALQLLVTLFPHLWRKRREAQAAQEFWSHGRMGENTSGKPLDAAIVAIRVRYFELMKLLK